MRNDDHGGLGGGRAPAGGADETPVVLREQVFLGVGEYRAARRPTVIKTVLGSCVSVCLFDRRESIGGLNHILLPGRADLAQGNAPARYGVNAMELLLNTMLRLGARRERLEAKAFGGAQLLLGAVGSVDSVGQRNIEFVVEFLRTERLRLVSQDLGGRDVRVIQLHTDTFEVHLKRVRNHALSEQRRRERDFLRRLDKKVEGKGVVDWF